MNSDRVLKTVKVFDEVKVDGKVRGVEWRVSRTAKLTGHAIRFDPVYNPIDQVTYARMTMDNGMVLMTGLHYDDDMALLEWIGADQ